MRPAPISATLILVVALLAGPGLLVLGLIGLVATSRRRSRCSTRCAWGVTS